jgi:hypothetical protein
MLSRILVTHPLSVAPGFPEVSSKKYCTGPLGSEPVVAVMVISVLLTAAGAEANVAGFGVGGSVSGAGGVVALAGLDAVPVFGMLSRICTV